MRAEPYLQRVTPHATFADLFDNAVAERGLPLGRIQARLEQAGVSVSVATLSYWRSGRSVPGRQLSKKALPLLEEILGTEPGTLSEHVGTPRPRGRAVRAQHDLFDQACDILPAGEMAIRAISTMGGSPISKLNRVAIHERLVVGRDRRERHTDIREVVMAEANEVSDLYAIHRQQSDEPNTPTIKGRRNCETVRTIESAHHRLTVAQLALSRKLSRGEGLAVEYRSMATGILNESSIVGRATATGVKVLVLEVIFDLQALPARIGSYVKYSADEPVPPLTKVPLVNGTAQVVFFDCAPGGYGMSWEWPT